MLDEFQENIVKNAAARSVIIAAAGSGKTEVLSERVIYLLQLGISPAQIAVITFTNLASEEMSSRIQEKIKDIALPFIGTIHSFVNQCLLKSGINTNKLLEQEKYDELLELGIKYPHIFNNYSYILWDEVQDSGPTEFNLIIDVINPYSFFLVGDPRQSLYSFKGGDPSLMMNLINQEDITTYYMNNNYRCGYNILNFAKKIIAPTGLPDDSRCASGRNGSVTEQPFSHATILTILKSYNDYSKTAILTRTNKEIDDMIFFLKRNGIPCVTFKQRDMNMKNLKDVLNSNTVKVLTVHSAKGMSFDNVITVGMRFYNTDERNVCYVAATRARDNLIWVTGKKKSSPRTRIHKW